MVFVLNGILILIGILGLEQNASAQEEVFSFHCEGKAEVAILNNGISLKELCGDSYQLAFNNTEGNLVNGHMGLYFSSKDEYHTDYSLPLLDDVIGSPYGVWEYDGSNTIIQNDIPCGTGYIIATVSGVNLFYEEAERAVRICDNSDIDLELTSTAKISSKVDLYTGNTHLGEQLERTLGYPLHIGVENKGKRRLDNTTIEGSHMVGFYLKRPNSTMTKHERCDIPDATIEDPYLGILTFSDGIEPGQVFTFEHGQDNKVNVSFDDQPPICGDAELVIMIDPLKMEPDSDPCNNFIQISVHVHCSPDIQKETCKVFPNYVEQGHEINAFFMDDEMRPRSYFRKTTSPEEWRLACSKKDRSILMALSRMFQFKKMLQMIHDDPNNGLCRWINKMHRENPKEDNASQGVPDMDPLQSNDANVISVFKKLDSVKNDMVRMHSFQDFEDMFKNIETSLDTIGDEVWKHILYGKFLGLKLVAGYNQYLLYHHMMGATVPKDLMVSTFSTPILTIAMTMHSYDSMPTYMKPYVVRQTLPYVIALDIMSELIPLPMDVEQRLRRVTRRIKIMMKPVLANSLPKMTTFPTKIPDMPDISFTTAIPRISPLPSAIPISSSASTVWPGMTLSSPVDCPFEMSDIEKVSSISKVLYHLVYAIGGQDEQSTDKLGPCHQNLVATYLRYGGARVQSRDIAEEIKSIAGNPKEIMKSCRQHPLIPPRVFPIYWKVQNGRIMEGTENPWTGNMFWKTTALCSCDHCTGKDDHNTNDTSDNRSQENFTSSDGSNEKTTYPTFD